MTNMRKSILQATRWALVLLLFWLALFFSWTSLSAVDFLFPLLYKHLEIGKSIDKYGPQNRYKHNFSSTTEVERRALFSQIVVAINNQGEGLEEIVYHDAQGQVTDQLLRPEEVVHLQDVADLISLLRNVTMIAAAIVGLLLFYAWSRRTDMDFPSQKQAWSGILIFLVALMAVLVVIGPTDVFYWLHTKIFPADHQWFFYYQESLMTTLMKAPIIFGYISVFIVLLTLIYFVVLMNLVRRMFKMSYRE